MDALDSRMSGSLFLDWAILAVSLYNTVLLLWLGLTVFLNAERRVWGIWMASGGLLLGALFFVSHSAITGHGLSPATPGLNFWWRIGWIPIAALPLVWYVVMLWYTGFWSHREWAGAAGSSLYRRQKGWFYFTLSAGVAWICFLLFFNPLPSLMQLSVENLARSPAVLGVPLLVLAYPLYTSLCVGLSLDALIRPAPSGRLMGELARRRARRWLISVSLILLAVGLLVGGLVIWFVRGSQPDLLSIESLATAAWADLVIESLIAAAVTLLGQGVITYEVFTGKSLPRRGLTQYWKRALALAAGFSLLLSGSLTFQLHPVYSVLLSLLLMVVFYALVGWRAFDERERFIRSLRPFVAHQKLNEILEGRPPRPVPEAEQVYEPFRALCAEILEAERACLLPTGALAPLSGGALIYPREPGFAPPDLSEILPLLVSPADLALPLDAARHGGMGFAVSLWNERGLTGVLLLGAKQTSGLYTQEEIEIARLMGEHLLDTKASVEMARRLVALQRQSLVQNQVLDQQARRVLHDEILPLVHTSLINLDRLERDSLTLALMEQFQEIHRRLSDLLRSTKSTTAVEIRRLGFLGALRKTVEVDLEGAFDQVVWEIDPEAKRALEQVPDLAAEVFFSAVREAGRNAARHGREPSSASSFCLSVGLHYRNGLCFVIEDNGAGFSPEEDMASAVDRPFPDAKGGLRYRAPESENDPAKGTASGGGQGLALHSTMMAVVGGSLAVESKAGRYTRVRVELPDAAWLNWDALQGEKLEK